MGDGVGEGARWRAQAPPERRPPCFFDPRHGPSTRDVEWAPDGYGAPRPVPVCEADAVRLEQGQEPMTREVVAGGRRVPMYDAPGFYGPYAGGFFGGFSGFLPGLLFGSMLGGAFGGWGADDASGSDGGGFGDFGGGGGGLGGDFGGGGELRRRGLRRRGLLSAGQRRSVAASWAAPPTSQKVPAQALEWGCMAPRTEELMELETRQEPRLVKALEMVAPGTALREGIDNIVHAKTGGLIVIGEPDDL